MSDLDAFHGPNAGYVLDLYDRYLESAESVGPEWRAYFQQFTPATPSTNGAAMATATPAAAPAAPVEKIAGAAALADAIREYGHLGCSIDPLGLPLPGAPDLDPEQVSVRELGYLGEFAALRTSVDLRLFEERVGDLIDFDAVAVDGPQRPLLDDRARKAGNRGRATLRGAELAVMWRPAARTWLGVNYSRLDIDSADPRLRDSAPRAMWSLLAAWSPTPDLQLSLNHHRVGEMGWQRGPSGLLPAYRITSLRAAHRFDIGGTRNEFALTLSNTGPRHADFLPEQHSGPVAYATLRIEL